MNALFTVDFLGTEELFAEARELFTENGLEFMPNILLVDSRTKLFLIEICYDRDVEKECVAASVCQSLMLALFIKYGGAPYRMSIAEMPLFAEAVKGTAPLAQKIEAALNPDGLLNFGKYSSFPLSME